MKHRSAAIGVWALGTACVSGQTFEWVAAPPGITGLLVRGISADGTAVVGSGYGLSNGRRAGFRWTQAQGLLWLSPFSGYISTDAQAISADGSVIVGEYEGIGTPSAFRWTEAGGVVQLPALTAAIPLATGVSGDGSVVVGFHSSLPYDAWKWTVSGGIEAFGGDWGVQGINRDGNAAVGPEQGGMHLWRAGSGHTSIAVPAGWLGVGAKGVSPEGGVVVGVLTTESLRHNAFRWSDGLGFRVLPLGNSESFAWAAAERASVIVGWIGQTAYAWTGDGRAVELRRYFLDAGIPLGSATLTQALGVSADGRTMAGAGSGGMWVATVPETFACYANCDGSTGTPILSALDVGCFLVRFGFRDPYCNCDGSTTPPTLNVNDFMCFLNRYAAGCG